MGCNIMKLLQENQHGILLLEGSVTPQGKLVLEGPMIQCNVKNRNGRVYDLELVGKPAVDDYNRDYINDGRAIGELEHPEYPMPKLSEAAVMIKHPLAWKGNLAVGRMEVLNSVKGQQIKALNEAGYRLGVSSRGLGEVDKFNNVKAGYLITAIDVVDRPSGQACYMTAINESVEWVQKGDIWVPASERVHVVDSVLKENADDKEFVERFKAILNHLS